MKDRAPIIDTIDKRNFKDDLKKTVVKRSRVHFVTVEEEEAMRRAESSLEDNYAESIDETTGDSASGRASEGVEILDPTLDVSDIDPDVLAQADEIFRRLQAEAEADEEAKRKEWEEKIAGANSVKDPDYNESTGSYSGKYGKGDVSDETRAQAEEILKMRNNELQSIIDENSADK
ncbi:MAG: hypothetical protein K6E39_00800 [Lachnospiraceae bacterium]|nr:hypothetical protein [Lachnospiraceae bacterium]